MALFSQSILFNYLLFILSLANFSASLSVPKILGNGMVLQAAPDKAQVWGSLDGVDSQVTLNIQCQSGHAADYVALNVSTIDLGREK